MPSSGARALHRPAVGKVYNACTSTRERSETFKPGTRVCLGFAMYLALGLASLRLGERAHTLVLALRFPALWLEIWVSTRSYGGLRSNLILSHDDPRCTCISSQPLVTRVMKIIEPSRSLVPSPKKLYKGPKAPNCRSNPRPDPSLANADKWLNKSSPKIWVRLQYTT